MTYETNYLSHHGIKGQKWGVRRFQNLDRTWTSAGKIRYGDGGDGRSVKSEPKATGRSSKSDSISSGRSTAKSHVSVTKTTKQSTKENVKKSSSNTRTKPSTKPTTVESKESTEQKKTGLTSNQKKLIAAGVGVAVAAGAVGAYTYVQKNKATGENYISKNKNLTDSDWYLDAGTSFSRIQTSKEFENHAFYATHEKVDQDKYLGLFGANLQSRASADAKASAKKAIASGSEEDILEAVKKREYADGLSVYQVKIDAVKKLKVPSDENASNITAKLLGEKDFRENATASILDAKNQMKRPQQQLLFKQAEKALQRSPEEMSKADKVAVYRAFNLSLTFHNEQQIAAQTRFYGELKKQGYSAILDLNDKEYSSYHAKSPMIVFDMDSVKLGAITEADPKLMQSLNRKYNAERARKEIGANTVGMASRYGKATVSDCRDYVNRKTNRHLSTPESRVTTQPRTVKTTNRYKYRNSMRKAKK